GGGEGLDGGGRQPGGLRRHGRHRRRAVRRQGRQRRVLLGGGGALRDDQEGRVQDGAREIGALQEGADGRRRRTDPDADDLGPGDRARNDHAGAGAERAARQGDRRLQGGHQGGGRQLRGAGRPAGLPGAVQARQEGLPV